MRIYDIIQKKKNGGRLTDQELKFAIQGYSGGSIPDYQMSALLMAICIRGMNSAETVQMTRCMIESGDTIDLSPIDGIKVDKHSTGGVGDKTTLVVGPIVAACGVPFVKMSGRGLGHTGGTIDKLESIPGFNTDITISKMLESVKDISICIAGQTSDLVPADKKIYALRDVTATVDNQSLIAASIMSKKIASGADAILLDVKSGSGAFTKTLDESIQLAKEMVQIGSKMGKETIALVTNMDNPLGETIGNSLEVIESIDTLLGKGPRDLTEVCIEIAANILVLAGKGTITNCRDLACRVLENHKAYEKFKELVVKQGGDVSFISDTKLFGKAPFIHEIKAPCEGYVSSIDTEIIGAVSVKLGAGREKKKDIINSCAGIIMNRKLGDKVKSGQVLAELHTSNCEILKEVEDIIRSAITVSNEKPNLKPCVLARVNSNGVVEYQ